MDADAPVEVPVAANSPEALRERIAMLRDACSAALSVEELVVIAVAQTAAATLAAGGVLFLVDGDELVTAASVGYSAEALARWSRFPLSADTPAGSAVRQRRGQWISHPRDKARCYPHLAQNLTGYGALAALPVASGGSVLGVLGISFRDAREFTPVERLFLLLLADQVGVALERVRDAGRADEAVRRDTTATSTHRRLFDRLSGVENLRHAAAVLLESALALDGVAGVVLTVEDEQTGSGCRVTHCDDPRTAATLGLLTTADHPSAGVTVRLLERRDLIGIPRGEATPPAEPGIGGAAQVLMRGHAVVGSLALALDGRADPGLLRRELLDLAQVGRVVLDREAANERRQLAAGRAAFLTAATANLEASLDVDETLQRMARIAVPALAEGCLVYLNERGRLRLAAATHLDVRVERRIRPELGEDPAFVRLVKSALHGPAATDVVLPDWLHAGRVSTTPLRARDKLVGAIVLLVAPSDGRPGLADATLMTDLAAHAAITIDNALLYATRSAEVAALQQRLLPPRLPILPEFDLAAYYEAGDRSLDVGGDFYDVIVPAPDRLVVLIGDVCGRGADAAAITGLARAVLRTVVEDGASPARALRRLNAAMRAAGERGEFCTAAVVQVDGRGDACRLRLAVGGHPLPLLRRGAETTPIGRHGPMLGLVPAPVFRESDIALSCDDVVLLYTDGVTEARRGRDFFSPQLATAVAGAGRSAADTIARTVAAVERFRDEGNDDIAMVALRPRGRAVTSVEVPELGDPSVLPRIFAAIGEALSGDAGARCELSRRVASALARLPEPPAGRAYVDVLRRPGRWRVEISRPAPRDGRADRRGAATPSGPVVPGSIRALRHGVQTLVSEEVPAHDA